MAANSYRFLTVWHVESSVQEVVSILGDADGLVRWWPSVYLDVLTLSPGERSGLGRVVSLYTKGWLPYTLRWQFRITEQNYPNGFTIRAWGDFVGQGVWTFTQDGPGSVCITYDWEVLAEKPLLKYFSWLVKPLFAANHRWAMARGEESLKLELARRHANSRAELAAVPQPPGPTFAFLLPADGRASSSLLA